MKILKKIKIDRLWIVVKEENGNKFAELVMIDKKMNEYRLKPRVYVSGEYLPIEIDIEQTDKSLIEKLKSNF